MKITIVYDNETLKENLKADWGFACIVDAEGRRILFDTGAKGSILLDNMRTLGIEPTSVEEIFISHSHWDHTGGLSEILNAKGKKIEVYIPASCSGDTDAAEIITVSSPLEIHPNIFSTGELKQIEQSMAVRTEGGIVVIAGCSHPSVGEILRAAAQYGQVKALIGGLHGFSDFDLLRNIDLVCATHCTQHKAEIQALFPENFIPGGVGTVIDL
ncbi:MAG: MBL fold metallo-hydrolase [Deltaproteobacteria bacterium]|nr:MBL fold metallo-hydrolase [Deltaproteobacteria bacterium]